VFRPPLRRLTALSIVCAASAVISCTGTDSTGPTVNGPNVTFVKMSAGDKFSCGLTADGTAWCWGLNDKGQLGDGTTNIRTTPTKVLTSARFTTIASGYAHTCALTIDGSAWCWGWNDLKQSGASVRGTLQLTPLALPGGLVFVSVAPSVTGTCATTSGTDVYCWGLIRHTDSFNSSGGDVVTEQPTKIGTGMIAVVAGLDNRYCSVDAAALAYCWLLVYTYPNAGPVIPPIGAPVSTTLHFTTLRVGYEHTCGLVANGQAWCWGQNSAGQLGDGTTRFSADPVPVAGGLSFESLAVGGGNIIVDDGAGISMKGGFSCGIAAGGKAYCWGSNRLGQLGLGTADSQAITPQPVAGGLSFTGLRAGGYHVCGLTTTSVAECWGDNPTGQLGDGTTKSSTKPTQVVTN
jgi:alpha-tubulin suppressor-like RCC1 family protein